MTSKRFFFVMLAVLIVLGLGVLTAVYFGNSFLAKQSNKLVSLKLDSEVADQQQTSLLQAKKDIEQYSDLSDAAKAVVPQDKDQAETVREIVKIAQDNFIGLSAINFPSSTLGTISPNSSSSSSSGGSENATPTISQVKGVSGIKGVYTMPITVQSDANSKVSYNNFIAFLHALENNRRTAQVSSINIVPDKADLSKLNFTLTLNVYLKP